MSATKHSVLLNALNEMAESPAYAVSKQVLREAEVLIVNQESDLVRLQAKIDEVNKLRDYEAKCGAENETLRKQIAELSERNAKLVNGLEEANKLYSEVLAKITELEQQVAELNKD